MISEYFYESLSIRDDRLYPSSRPLKCGSVGRVETVGEKAQKYAVEKQ